MPYLMFLQLVLSPWLNRKSKVKDWILRFHPTSSLQPVWVLLSPGCRRPNARTKRLAGDSREPLHQATSGISAAPNAGI